MMHASSRWPAGVLALALAVLIVYETGVVRRTSSATYDEVTYADMAFDVRAGDLTAMVDRGVAPLPVMLDVLATRPFQSDDTRTPKLLAITNRIRLVHALTTAVPLILAVYFWLLGRRGALVAFCAAACLALSPTVVAHASLATTDAGIALWSVATLAALVWHNQRPGIARLAVVAVALGLACAAKYSAVALVPAVFLAVGWRRFPAVAAAALMVVWALTGFSLFALTPAGADAVFGGGTIAHAWPALKQLRLPAPIVSAIEQWAHQQNGHDAFLMGRSDSSGWWYYMPVALALKCTPAELAVAAALPFLIGAAWRKRTQAFTLLTLTLATYAALLLLNKVDIGVRYALPLFPLAALCAADAIGALALPAIAVTAIGIAAVGLQAFEAVRITPHYLSYFNEFAGGPQNGYRYLGDSNIDWGQDLPALRAEINKLGREHVCLAYFGEARPAIYGVTAADWRHPADCGGAEWLAVSVTYIQGSYIDDDPFQDLLNETPDRRAAYSIFLYRTDRPVVAAALKNALKSVGSQ